MEVETTEILQRLVRFDTVNPPGNERPAQEYLAGLLSGAGFHVDLLGAEPGRPNLVARLDGAQDGPALCYLSHVDTVLANPEEWERDPWSGDVVDGYLWGRGALDMKSQTAAEVAAALSLARAGWRPRRGALLIVCVVDEETGGALGAQWITENHPDKVRCDYLINEGAGERFEFGGRRRYGVCCAEKGVFRFTVSTSGVAAHASLPRMGDNALLKLAPLIQRLGERQPSFTWTDEPRALLAALGAPVDEGPEAALAHVRAADPRAAAVIEPMLGVTLAPTKVRASEKINVIPSAAHLQVDCRVPPGLGEEAALAGAREVLGPDGDGYALAFTEQVMGNRSPMDTPLMERIAAWVSANDPGAEAVPTVLAGFSDSRHFRAAFPDCVAYGFFPQRTMSLYDTSPLVHSANERIATADLGFAAAFFRDLAEGILA